METKSCALIKFMISFLVISFKIWKHVKHFLNSLRGAGKQNNVKIPPSTQIQPSLCGPTSP